ncbi:MAG: ATP-binding protein [Microcystaceae cyanobacterium]
MPTETLLQLLDALVLEKTGESLSHLQKTIIKGSLEGQTYSDIADETYLSEGHISDKGSELWKLLSDLLGVDISKKTVRGILEKGDFYNNIGRNFVVKDFLALNNVHICPDTPNSNQTPPQPEEHPIQTYLDLGNLPDNLNFYGRTEELNTLEKWMIENRCHLIMILGLKGMGKTTLSRQLIEQIKPHFDYLIYRSLYFSPSLDKLITQLLTIFPKSVTTPTDIEDKITCLLNYFKQYRCLIILDDWHQLFQPNKLAGNYKQGYKYYRLFLKEISKQSSQSCVVLNSQEACPKMTLLTQKNPSVRSYILSGLGEASKVILRDYHLLDEDQWDILIEHYQGHPQWLEMTSSLIQELFQGSVAQFSSYSSLILANPIKDDLDELFQRLNEQEKTIITAFYKENEPLFLEQLSNKLSYPPSDILNAIDSLKRRIVLDLEQQNKKTLVLINPILKEYIASLNEW